jgi:hypothetical protein
MKIHNDHMYHGAALCQIAEYPRRTEINAFESGGQISRNGFVVNRRIGLYLKYCTHHQEPYHEYRFYFTQDNLREIALMQRKTEKLFFGLICVREGEICCLSSHEIEELVNRRRQSKGKEENRYGIIVAFEQQERFRVYVNSPETRSQRLGDPILIPRNDFPRRLFC